MGHASFFTRFSANYERRRKISQIFDSRVSPRSRLFNNRTNPPFVHGEESYKRNCYANSKVIKPFVFLWSFINYKKLVKKIVKSPSTAKKYFFQQQNYSAMPQQSFTKKNINKKNINAS